MLTNVFNISHLVKFTLTTLYTGRLGPVQEGESKGSLAEREKVLTNIRGRSGIPTHRSHILLGF
jgi:hypothetical protein